MTSINPWSDGIKPAGANISSIKAKTDIIGASVALENAGNLAALLKRLILNWDVKTNIPVYNVKAGTWAFSADLSQFMGGFLRNTSSAINDAIMVAFWAPNTNPITLNIRGQTNASAAILTFYVDGVSQGTLDQYSAGTVYNVIQTISITPARAGSNVLLIQATAKNASSASYLVDISEMWVS